MQLSDELTLSYYKPVADIDQTHRVQLVQDTRTGKFFVQKALTVYNIEVFRSLQEHPIAHMPRIYVLAEDKEQLIVIEEYLAGVSLQEMLEENGVFPENQALDIILQLCGIVYALHHRTPAIIHRDIKPSNLILSSDGILSLLDFNAAKFSSSKDSGQCRDTRLLGTTGYAAPEQYGFGVSTTQADLYAIGVLFNVLLTGHIPSEQMAEGIFAPVITRCTKLEPAERYANVDLLIRELTSLRQNVTADHTRNTQSYTELSATAVSAAAAATPYNAATADVHFPNEHIGINKSPDTNSPLRPADGSHSEWRFLPPGFRSGNPLHILAAIIGYLMIFYIGCNLTTENGSLADTVLNRIIFILMSLFIVFFSCNYANMQKHFPLANSLKNVLRILGIVLYDILFAVLFFLVLVILETLFFPV